jgi:hypothetical protein
MNSNVFVIYVRSLDDLYHVDIVVEQVKAMMWNSIGIVVNLYLSIGLCYGLEYLMLWMMMENHQDLSREEEMMMNGKNQCWFFTSS